MTSDGALTAVDLAPLEQALGHTFSDKTQIIAALTHPSVIGTGAVTAAEAYERLEFLGDRVLGLVVAEMLLEAFPDEREGDIAKRHSVMVRSQTLAEVAKRIRLGHLIQAAPGDAAIKTDVVENKSILADACEAVIAALYRDGGLEAARAFIRLEWTGIMTAAEKPPQDAKTSIQEWAQQQGIPLPQYKVLDRAGPDHAPTFTIGLSLQGFDMVSAVGTSKQKAEQAAARLMLDQVSATGKTKS